MYIKSFGAQKGGFEQTPSNLPSLWPCYMCLFSFRRLTHDLFLLCFFLGMVRKKRGGRGGWGEDAWSVKYECTLICCSKSYWKYFQVNSTIKPLYGSGSCCSYKLHVFSCVDSSHFHGTTALAIYTV